MQKISAGSPTVPRVAPFVIFLGLTFCQGKFGETSAQWFYLAKTVIGAWLLWEMRPHVLEMRWAFSGEAVAVGIGVFAIWVGLDPLYPHLFKTGATGNPNEQFGAGSAPAWFF